MKDKPDYKITLPDGYNIDVMSKKPSVLGGISLLQDFDLIKFIVENSRYSWPKYNNSLIHKIFLKVQEKKWQEKYNPVMVQLYKFYFEFQKDNRVILIEKRRLQTAFVCMIIEGYLFPAEFPKLKLKVGEDKISKKIKLIFDLYYKDYKKEASEDSFEIIRWVRNSVVHGEGLTGLIDSFKEKKKSEFTKFWKLKDTGQKMKKENFLEHFIFEFNYLFEDMMLRSLGATDEELGWNGRPPWNSDFWK